MKSEDEVVKEINGLLKQAEILVDQAVVLANAYVNAIPDNDPEGDDYEREEAIEEFRWSLATGGLLESIADLEGENSSFSEWLQSHC